MPDTRVGVDSALLFGLAVARWQAGASAGRRASPTPSREVLAARRRAAQPCSPPTGPRSPRDVVGEPLFVARARRTASSSPPSRTTTSPAGASVPDRSVVTRRRATASTDDARSTTLEETACPDHRRATSRPTTSRRPCAADVRGGPDRDAQGAAAEVLLRRSRQRAVRGDHPAAGVLPDPRRGEHPARRRRRDRRRTKARHAASSSGPGRRRRRGCCCDALRDVGTLETLRARSTSAPTRSRRRCRGLVADYPGLEVHGVVADFERAPRDAADRTGRGWWPSSAARSATSTRRSAATSSAPSARPLRAGRRAAARHRPGQGRRPPGPCVRRRGRRDRGVQPQRAARDQPRARRRLRRRAPSRHVAMWDAEQEWIEMRLRVGTRADRRRARPRS